ncbi:hypothetical protein D0T25_23950 [Duganella sp. BJB488]|uniref:substrate-binding periplasmic protein n=1 Tax=unclassified Duganella TaxID=2636909 RepID=UPI000E351885|nr:MULTISPECIES: transporter substrate-binding domain-containing protein [unclassified Duganella]RFP13284.1 hypothetical protein D0T26_23670 [Duganella sp. BJB489]RFP17140.1 hypothetical protein D0T25_23950 [Duganella sp. BJB488]RFP31641.1 hypothetical protein D0T24_24765 [Duganella sp. BJB480]
MTRKFIVITTIFLTILSFLPSHAIWAEPQYSELKFMVPDGPPFGYRKDDKITGIAYDIMIEALSLSGYTASVQITPLSRAIQSLKAGVIDGVFPLYKTAEREEFMSFAGEALFTQTISLFSRTGSALNSEGD